jgi:hypothetical protein
VEDFEEQEQGYLVNIMLIQNSLASIEIPMKA